jgi:hypothetical protein
MFLVVITGIIFSGLGYGVYTFKKMAQENADLQAQFAVLKNSDNKQTPVATSTETPAVPIIIESSATVSTSTNVAQKENVTEVKTLTPTKPVAKIVQDNPSAETVSTKTKDVTSEQPKTETQAQLPVSVPVSSPIKVLAVRQASFADGYGGTYGSYEIQIQVSSANGDILIPMTTNDSVGTGVIGFTYSIIGDTFKGVQKSKFSGCSNIKNNYCKFGEGQTKDLTLTVFLTPYSNGTGNYSVEFNQLSYTENGIDKTYDINRKTQNINLVY